MNQYDLIEPIGEGTYGVVYKCRDKRTGRIVAVKQFKNFQINAYIRCTMLRELRVEQLLKGEPNVTQLLETFKQKNRLYLVMEYIPRSLLDVLEEHRTGIPENALVSLLYTLLLGIRSCHRNGIIHRDVKPENILVRDDGSASLCDFGFCRPVLQQDQQQQQQRGSINNTERGSAEGLSSAAPKARGPNAKNGASSPSLATSAFLSELVLADHRGVMTDYVATRWYRSPEMLLGMSDYSYGVDMWAVGAIMAEAIDGEPLLPGKTELEQLSLIQSRIGDFPPAYEAAVRKRNGGMLHLRSANPFAKLQSRARVRLSSTDDSAASSRDSGTISSYLSMRYGGRINKHGMHLLGQLLCVDADGRITVEDALVHPYFDTLRQGSRFATPDGSATENNEPSGCTKAPARESTKAFIQQATGSSTEVLPGLSPTLRTTGTPLAASVRRNSFLSAVDAIASRPPPAGDLDAAARASAQESSQLSGVSATSAWQSASPFPGLAALPTLEDSTTEGANVARAAAEGLGVADDNIVDAGNSPPPRPVLPDVTRLDGAAAPQQHAASEGASGDGGRSSNIVFKGPEAHVSTLLFKTRRNRAVAEAGLLHRRPSQSEEGVSSTAFGCRPPHTTTTAGILAPLSRRRSGDEETVVPSNENEKPPPKTPHPSPQPFLPSFADKPSLDSNAKSGKGQSATHGEPLVLEKPCGARDEEACACTSAPRSGGDRRFSREGTAHKRTNSYTEQQVQHRTPKAAAKVQRRGLRQPYKSMTSRDSALTSSTTSASPVRTHGTAESGEGAALTATVVERHSTKQRGHSVPRRNRLVVRTPAAAKQVAAGKTACTPAPRKSGGRRVSPGGASVTAVEGRGTAGVDASRFASPKLPRVIKPLQPRERMSLLREIKSLDCPVETLSAVEVMLPARPSLSDRDATAEDGDGSSAPASTASSGSASDAEDLGSASASQLTAENDEIYVEDLDTDCVSHSPLLSEASGQEDAAAPPPAPITFAGRKEAAVAAAPDTGATQRRPPRMDFVHHTASANTSTTTADNAHSSRAQPSLFFRSFRNAPAPLKLAGVYQDRSNGAPLPLTMIGSGSGAGASVSTEGSFSPPAYHGSASATAASQPPSTSFFSASPSLVRRPTPTLLRHPQLKASTSEHSPHSPSFDAHTAPSEGRRGTLQPGGLSAGVDTSSSRALQDSSPSYNPLASPFPFHKVSTSYLSAGASRYPAEEAAMSDLRAALPTPQRRLSATHMSLSISGEISAMGGAAAAESGSGGGSLAMSFRSQERLPHLVVPAATPPRPIAEEVDTEVLVCTPLAPPPVSNRGSPATVAQTPSPPVSGSTDVMSSCPTREASVQLTTPHRPNSRGLTSATRQGSSNRASSVANLTRLRTPSLQMTPPSCARKSGSGGRREGEKTEKTGKDEEGDLQSAAQTVSFPLPSSGERSGPSADSTPAVRSVPLTLNHPQPVLGGVWVNVDPQRNGQSLHAGSSRKKGRLIL